MGDRRNDAGLGDRGGGLSESWAFGIFWVPDISQPSLFTRETGGLSTVGWGSRGPRAVTPFVDCRRRFQASRTQLLHPACNALRTQYCSKRAHCLSRTLVLVTGHHGRLCRPELRRKRKRRAFRVPRSERKCFFTPRCEQIWLRSVKTLTLASPRPSVRGSFFVGRKSQGLTATPDPTEEIRPIPRRMWLAG